MRKYFINNYKCILAMGLSKAAAAFFGAGIPMVTAELVNNIETISWGQGRKYALLYISTIVCLMLSLYFCKIFACRMARNVNYQLKSDLVEHVLNMKQNDFYKEEKSFYVSLATEDAKNAYYSYYECVIEGVTSAINLVIYSILMLGMNWIMGMVIIICCLFCMLVPEIAGERLSKLNMEFLKKHGEHIGILTELFDGFVLVNRRTRKAFSKLHSNMCRERETALYLLNSFKALVDTVSGSCTYIINIAAFICGIILLNNKMIQVGDFVGLLAFIEFIVGPLQDVVYQYMEIKSSKDLISKVKSYLNIETSELPICKEFKNSIKIENLYTTVGDFSLKNISIEFKKNKKYAIIGKSGSGKSTILRTIMGCNPEYSGCVTIDGTDIREMDTSFVFSSIEQDTVVFSGSTKDNITLFGSYKEDRLDEFIDKTNSNALMRDEVMEQGCSLSGGEKNKLAILRALVKGGSVLLCDEMFSALDKKNKNLLSAFLLRIPELTIVSITHDISDEALGYYDEVIIMDEGTIIFKGTPEDIKIKQLKRS